MEPQILEEANTSRLKFSENELQTLSQVPVHKMAASQSGGQEDETLLVRIELQDQIFEQRASLQLVQEANDAAPSDELKEMCADLIASIHTMESSLAQLITAASVTTPPVLAQLSNSQGASGLLLEEGDRCNAVGDNQKETETSGATDPFRKTESQAVGFLKKGFKDDISENRLRFEAGDRCRFRGGDGTLLEVDGDGGHAVVAYTNPTTSQMRLCSFFAQQRCKFGEDCRSFHGMRVRARRLRPYQGPPQGGPTLGDQVLALREETGLWEAAELEKKEGGRESMKLQVAFVRDGKRATLVPESIEILDPLPPGSPPSSSDSEPSGGDADLSGKGDADLSGEEDQNPREGLGAARGVGFPGGGGEETIGQRMTSWGVDYRADAEAMTSAGVQKETRLLAGWEEHTRGVASKLMASMGFVAGGGLGQDNQGMVNPIPVAVLPKGVALDFVGGQRRGTEGKKKSRGGEKSRKRKAAQAARESRAEEGSDDDMFSLINKQLAGPPTESGRRVETVRKVKKGAPEVTERQRLLAQGEDVEELRRRVVKLREMADRNKKDRTVFAAVQRKLDETQKALAHAEAAHESIHQQIHEKESHKKLMKW